MASIRGSDTKPERVVRSLLHVAGFRFRLHRKDLPGRPDILLPKHRLAIFVHGCFWHHHAGCSFAYMPKSNREFWRKKFDANALRDERVLADLQERGWRTLVVWECHLKNSDNMKRLSGRLAKEVLSQGARHSELS